jgi:O-antigen ligase
MLFYCAFWLALAALRAGHARFFAMLAGFAAFIAVLSVVQWLLPGYHVFRAEAGQAVALEGGFARIRPPGLILVYFAFLFAIAYLAWGPARQRARAGVLAAMCATALLLSLNRNMILGSVIGLITVLVVARQRRRGTVILGTLAIIAVLTLTFMGSGAVAERILSIGNRSGLQQTLAYRAYENQHAVPVIGRHPVFGIGWGTDYGALLAQNGTGALTNRSFIHNQYYGLWLRTGLLGLSAYLALLVGTAIAGIRYVRSRANHADAWIGAGLLASVVGLAASSVVGVYVIDAGSAVPAACLFALGAFLHERLREPSTASARASVERG